MPQAVNDIMGAVKTPSCESFHRTTLEDARVAYSLSDMFLRGSAGSSSPVIVIGGL